jgi:very-short-patch-repair endonuclease
MRKNMASKWDSYEYLYEQYVVKKRSTKSIAEEHGTYPNTIRRCLKKHGFDIRDKSEAQKNYIEINGSPMLGRERTKEEKERISRGLQEFWVNLPDEQKDQIRENMAESARKQWDSLSEHTKKEAIYRMHLASKSKMYLGSKNENLVAKMIVESGFRIHQRTTDYTPGNRFEIDIAIPDLRVAIEWDGATHFMPIYGEEHLKRVMEKDHVKDQVLVNAGWRVIRCRDHSTAHSKAFCRRAVDKILDEIEKVKVSKRSPGVTILDME